MKQILLPCIGIAMLVTGCSSPKIALNGEGFTEMPVKGRNGFLIKQKLSFGNYKTTSVKRSWTKGSTGSSGFGLGTPGTPDYDNIISKEYTKRKQTLNFELTDGEFKSEVRCVSKFSSEELIVGNNKNSLPNIIIDLIRGNRSSNTFYIQAFEDSNTKPWQLLLDNSATQANAKKYIGVFALDDHNYYNIVPVYKMKNKKGEAKNILFGSVGLDIKNKENKSVATISLMDNGKVYMNSNSKQETFLLANLSAALLLQQQIGD